MPTYGYNDSDFYLPAYNPMQYSYATIPNVAPSGAIGAGSGGGLFSGVGSSALTGGLLAAGGSFLSNLIALKNANKQRELDRQQQQALTTQGLQSNEQQNTQALASHESTLDPFRQQMSQASDLNKLYRAGSSSYTPVRVSAPWPGQRMPQVSGGYSYAENPQRGADLAAILASIRAGNGAPTMTNPANYGKTSAVNVKGVAEGTIDPSSPHAFATGAPAPPSAIGADPAAQAIRNAYRHFLGRDPSDYEIQSQTGTGSFTITDPRLQKSIDNIRQAALGQAPEPTPRTTTRPDWTYSYAA